MTLYSFKLSAAKKAEKPAKKAKKPVAKKEKKAKKPDRKPKAPKKVISLHVQNIIIIIYLLIKIHQIWTILKTFVG